MKNCSRKLAGPSLFWHMQKPPYALGSVSQFQGHSCSRAWGELAPYWAPHTPPVHLHPPAFPPSTTHSSTHSSPPNQGAFFSFGPNHGFSPNNVVYFSNGLGRSHARQGCPSPPLILTVCAAGRGCDRKVHVSMVFHHRRAQCYLYFLAVYHWFARFTLFSIGLKSCGS